MRYGEGDTHRHEGYPGAELSQQCLAVQTAEPRHQVVPWRRDVRTVVSTPDIVKARGSTRVHARIQKIRDTGSCDERGNGGSDNTGTTDNDPGTVD